MVTVYAVAVYAAGKQHSSKVATTVVNYYPTGNYAQFSMLFVSEASYFHAFKLIALLCVILCFTVLFTSLILMH